LLDAAVAGDEPYLLARRNPDNIIIVARKRIDGVRYAIEQCAADVVVLDDGFQHRAVDRDINLLLLDARRPYGNGWPLPAGLLREFRLAQRRADIVLLTRAGNDVVTSLVEVPAFFSQHLLADVGVGLDGCRIALSDLTGMKLCAFSGIADPASFFSALEARGTKTHRTLALPDHCIYDDSILEKISQRARGCDALLTTEKDAVKLMPAMFSVPCYQIPLGISIADEKKFRQTIMTLLEKI
jgi:tetraacyldisaccharide 4'-kinase